MENSKLAGSAGAAKGRRDAPGRLRDNVPSKKMRRIQSSLRLDPLNLTATDATPRPIHAAAASTMKSLSRI